jgi:hypothetical protein
MADTANIKNIRRRILGPSKRELHSTLMHQKKLETGHHAQLENFLTNHGLLLVQIVQTLGQLTPAITEMRERLQETGHGDAAISQARLDALEAIVDGLAIRHQAATGTEAQPLEAPGFGAGESGSHSVIRELEELRTQFTATAGQASLPQLTGMLANVENALLNVSAMVGELLGGGLASRLDVVQNDLTDLRAQMVLQAGHAEGLNTLLDAQNAQVRGIADEWRAASAGITDELSGKLDNVLNGMANLTALATTIAGPAQTGVNGRLENISNALSNIDALAKQLAGQDVSGRIERIERDIARLGDTLGMGLASVGGLSAELDTRHAQSRAGQEQLHTQMLAAGAATGELSGKLDNVSNALLNIAAMVSGLVGEGTASRLQRIETMQDRLAAQIQDLSRTLATVGARIDDELTRQNGAAAATTDSAR